MTSERSGIAVTGLGAVSPIGIGVPAFTRALRRGDSGVRLLDEPSFRCVSSVAAMCAEFDPSSVMSGADVRRLPRLVPMALAAAREAMAQAGKAIDDPDVARRVGLILGTGAGGIDFTLDQAHVAYTPAVSSGQGCETDHPGDRMCTAERAGAVRNPSLWTITNATHGNLAGELSIRLGLRGPSLCVSTGCASSSDAIGHAMGLLRSDRPGSVDCVVVVGADAHVRWETLLGMELLRVISTRDFKGNPEEASTASRPFCATRDGFVLGEGAWAMVLERPGVAARRGAREVGQVLGYAATCDAYHRVRPDPDMGECVRAILLAIEDAACSPGEIELVQYHGTATRLNDALETAAVKIAFGDHARQLRGSSIKSMIGHPQGASGAASVVGMLGALTNADGDDAGPFVPPTINHVQADPACDLEYTADGAVTTDARLALVNCLAFGAKNSSIVLRANR